MLHLWAIFRESFSTFVTTENGPFLFYMSLTRIQAQKKNTDETILLIINGKKFSLSQADITKEGTGSKIKAALQAKIEKGGELLAIFIHTNDDGSVAVATGSEPDVWPEDEVDLNG